MTTHRRGPWSQAEDAYLCQLVHTQGALNWVRIAQLIGSRSPKQCRERYHQNLKPSLNHEPISHEEGIQIEKMVSEMGKRWAEIARRLHGRSDNAVKNWWNGSMNRRKRMVVRRNMSNHDVDYDNRLELYSHHPQRTQYHDQHRLPRQPCAAYSQRGYSYPPLPPPSYSHAVTDFDSQPYRHPQYYDKAQPSPATSELSRTESMDHAPSLISDNGSLYSVSPRGAPSPNPELPFHNSMRTDPQRSSVQTQQSTSVLSPIKEYTSNTYLSQRFSETCSKSREEYKPADTPRSYQVSSQLPSYSPQHHNEVSVQNRNDASRIHLPPLRTYATTPTFSDARMNLSSLLG